MYMYTLLKLGFYLYRWDPRVKVESYLNLYIPAIYMKLPFLKCSATMWLTQTWDY